MACGGLGGGLPISVASVFCHSVRVELPRRSKEPMGERYDSGRRSGEYFATSSTLSYQQAVFRRLCCLVKGTLGDLENMVATRGDVRKTKKAMDDSEVQTLFWRQPSDSATRIR